MGILRFRWSPSKILRRGQIRLVRSTILKSSRSDDVIFVTVMNLVMLHQSQSVQSLHRQHDQRRNLQEKMLSSHHLGVHHRNPKVMSSLQRFLVITPEASAIRKYRKKASIPKFFKQVLLFCYPWVLYILTATMTLQLYQLLLNVLNHLRCIII